MLLAFIDSGMQNNLQEGADLLKEQQSLHVYIERYLKKKKKKDQPKEASTAGLIIHNELLP